MDTKSGSEQPKNYTASMVARILGCSLRSIYRWEKDNQIPQARRIDVGGISVRVFTPKEIEAIRKIVQARLMFVARISDYPPKKKKSSRPSVKAVAIREQRLIDSKLA